MILFVFKEFYSCLTTVLYSIIEVNHGGVIITFSFTYCTVKYTLAIVLVPDFIRVTFLIPRE